MGFIAWIVLGGVAGWIASMIMKTNENMGIFANIIVGVIGAGIGGFVMNLIGGEGVDGFNIWSLLVAILGAVILLWIVSLFTNKK